MSLLLVEVLQHIRLFINIILTLFAVYFGVMAFFGLFKDRKYPKATTKKKFAILIAARNEAVVLPNLIGSLKEQNYPKELYDIVVMPNNCTDDTEEVAKAAGVMIFNHRKPVKSKGDVLHQYFREIMKTGSDYDAFVVFDADNIVDKKYLQKVNDALNAGVKVGQGYRASKNPGDTVISGSYSIYYYMIDRFYNRARGVLDLSCLINGSGFVVSKEIIEKFGGWFTYTMTEDIEFSTLCVLAKEKVQWLPEAVFYDEQPLTFEQSWNQRKRWSTGCIQGLERYGWSLLVQAVTQGSRSALDFLMFYLTPVIQVLCFIAFINMSILSVLYYSLQMYSRIHVFIYLAYLLFFVLVGVFTSVLTLKLEKRDYREMRKSIFYFWFFILSWIPINVVCLIKKQTVWLPIAHTRIVSISEVGK